jgi:hypothetical protein
VLNGGYSNEGKVTRYNQKTGQTETCHTFSPKMIASSCQFMDDATASRCFEVYMRPAKRLDIPTFFSKGCGKKEANEVVNKMLSYRLSNFIKIDESKSYPELAKFPPRIREIFSPILIGQNYETIPDWMERIMLDHSEKMVATTSLSDDAIIASALLYLTKDGEMKILTKDIRSHILNTTEEDIPYKAVASAVRNLGVKTRMCNSNTMATVKPRDIEYLKRKYPQD